MRWAIAIPFASNILPKMSIPTIIIELEIIPPYNGNLPFSTAKNFAK
jgi:hypothetical protein